MADCDLAGAHIAGQASESQAATDISTQVDDQAFTSLQVEVVNCTIQCGRETQSRRRRKIGDLEKSNVLADSRMNWALRFDNRRALLRPFPLWHVNHDFLCASCAFVTSKVWEWPIVNDGMEGGRGDCIIHCLQYIPGVIPAT